MLFPKKKLRTAAHLNENTFQGKYLFEGEGGKNSLRAAAPLNENSFLRKGDLDLVPETGMYIYIYIYGVPRSIDRGGSAAGIAEEVRCGTKELHGA